MQNTFRFDDIFVHDNLKILILISEKKIIEKVRVTLFTFKLHSAELLSFYRDFQKFQILAFVTGVILCQF